MGNVHDLASSNSLVSQFMAELRDVTFQQDRARFRQNLHRLGQIMAYEVSKTLAFTIKTVQTPLAKARCATLEEAPVLATVLRAGVPFHEGFLSFFDRADNAFMFAYRKHDEKGAFEIAAHYLACPKLEGRTLIVCDPMLATGASMITTVEHLLQHGTPKAIHLTCAIASAAGVKAVADCFPKATIWAGAIDPELDSRKYIVPGLGDAGDLAFGEKLQR